MAESLRRSEVDPAPSTGNVSAALAEGHDTAPAAATAPPAVLAAAATQDGKASANGAEALAAFKAALTEGSKAKAVELWAKVPADQKKSLAAAPDTVATMIRVMHEEAFAPMREIGVDFTASPSLGPAVFDIIPSVGASVLQKKLTAAGLWASFLAAPPSHGALSAGQAQTLGSLVDKAGDTASARQVFEKAYPALQDNSYNNGILKTNAWGKDEIKRLYRALSSHLPVNEVQAVTGGFYLGTQHNLTGTGFQTLNFAWYHIGNVVLNKTSAGADGGGTNHDMTGGTQSGVTVKGTKDDPTQTHFTGSVLHEVGHAVGDHSDGNSWATGYYDWKVEAADSWSQQLFDDKKAQAVVDAKKLKEKILPASEARQWLAAQVALQSHTVSGWAKEEDIRKFIQAHYSDQPLYLYWKTVRVDGQPEYHVSDAANVHGDRCYVWLTRMSNAYVSYKKECLEKKVSWYGISSDKEWFAEQYSHFYRTQKQGTGQADGVKKKLAELDGMKWDPASQKLTAGGAGSAKATPAGPAPASDREAAQAEPVPAAAQIRRLPLAW